MNIIPSHWSGFDKKYLEEKMLQLLYSPNCQVYGYPHSNSSLPQHCNRDETAWI